MKNYKLYLIGTIVLLLGLAIGWFAKPNTTSAGGMNHEHDSSTDNVNIDSEQIWTCSMHPQIRQNEPGQCPICEMDLIPLDNSMGSDDPTILQMSQEAVKLAQIETYVIGDRTTDKVSKGKNFTIKVDGTVELDERTIKSQTAHLSGRIETMQVTFEGQYVSAGQKIASIYSTELLAASQELLTAAQYNDRVEGLEDAAKQKLKNWKIKDSQIQKILLTGKTIETIDVYADHSGYVLSKKLSHGDYIKQGQTLYTSGSTEKVWLVFNVFESDISKVEKGSNLTFTTPSVPGKNFSATINYVEPLLNSASRTATVRAEINNNRNQLKPGMLLNGKIETTDKISGDQKNIALRIPNTAILWTGDKSVVYVQLKDTEVPSYQFREVTVSNRSSEFSMISDGLKIGEEIVMHGAFAIDAAAQLNNNMSMMNKNVSIKKEVKPDVVPSYTEITPTQFKSELDNSVVSYIILKDALVLTDQSAANNAAATFLESLSTIDMTLIKGEGHMYWMEQLKSLQSHGEKIKNSTDIEEQRNQFDFLSQAMINSMKAFGTDNKTYYVQYCPMAKGNQGADWIATENQIRNPYFGDKMMKCGSVKLELN